MSGKKGSQMRRNTGRMTLNFILQKIIKIGDYSEEGHQANEGSRTMCIEVIKELVILSIKR